ncbi:MAG TPA: hypothetical protein VN457_05635 [Chlamydiales bacterium]|nr:hypothetical protein [Chlamydiales bacterium]
MDKISELDASYEQFMKHLPKLIPDGIIEVDLEILKHFGLLGEELPPHSPSLTRFFHVVESKEKITLYNEQFAIWVVPESCHDEPITLVLIAINRENELKLEMGFATSGIYNTSKLVLRILEKFLAEIQETEEVISHLKERD